AHAGEPVLRSHARIPESPDAPPVQPGSFPNRLRPSDPTSPSYGVSDDAAYSLPVDPPHSHRSVMKQFGGGRPVRMDGFVDAYLEKASGREVLPIIHWWRIEGLFLFLALAIGLALGFTLGWVWGGVVAGAIALVGTGAGV